MGCLDVELVLSNGEGCRTQALVGLHIGAGNKVRCIQRYPRRNRDNQTDQLRPHGLQPALPGDGQVDRHSCLLIALQYADQVLRTRLVLIHPVEVDEHRPWLMLQQVTENGGME